MGDTDRTKLETLLRAWGVGYTIQGDDIRCETYDNKIGGYAGFFTRFEFTPEGAFVQMGAWE